VAALAAGGIRDEPGDQSRKLTAHGRCPNGGAVLNVVLVWFVSSDAEVARDSHTERADGGDYVRFVGNVWKVEGDVMTVCMLW
jgi:hypothetical protein